MKSIYWVVGLLALIFFGCRSTGQLQKKYSLQVYEALGLKQERKDNFMLYKEAASWLNVPHRDGGLSATGIDCSGLVGAIYKNVYNKILERNSVSILQKNCSKISKNQLHEGDLVFFNSGKGSKKPTTINHVGVYLKDNKFQHASTSQGVIVSSLNENYYQKIWINNSRNARKN